DWAGSGQAWRPTSRPGWRVCGSSRRPAPGKAAAVERPRKLARKSGRDDADRRGKGAAMGSLGGWEILIILGVLVLLFGAKRLPDMARSVGQSARVFKGEMKGLRDDEKGTDK